MWFADVEIKEDACWQIKDLNDWLVKMQAAFEEFYRVLKPAGAIAFEVGEIRKGNILLENEIVKVAMKTGFAAECILINAQNFTKTANCWGVKNNEAGTNTNRIVILTKAKSSNFAFYTPRQTSTFRQPTLF